VTDFRGGDAVDEYRRALLGAARDRAVAEAEQEVCLAWAAELAHVGHMTRLGVATAQAACEAARTLVRARQAAGDAPALLEAQRRLELAEEQARQSVGAADALLEIIGEEQELMSRAAQERSLVAQANRVRVWSAWEVVQSFAADWPCPELDGPDGFDPTAAAPTQSAAAPTQSQTQPQTQAQAPRTRAPAHAREVVSRRKFWRIKGTPGNGTGPGNGTRPDSGPGTW
jgi:hypothetical protein